MARTRSDRIATDLSEQASETASDVRVGDAIIYSRYGGQEISIDGEDLLILSARDVVVVAEVVGSSPSTEGEPDSPRTTLADRLRHMLAAVTDIQAEEAAAKRTTLLRAMMVAGVDPIPAETIAQARRLARQREHLLTSGAYTTEALRELRGDAKSSTTRTWLARRRAADEVFTVTHDGSTLVPAFELDEEGRPRKAIASVLRALAPAQLDGWATWTWFASGSPWLGGAVPSEVLAVDPPRVARAASRFAANAA
jgi:hypothetical protein